MDLFPINVPSTFEPILTFEYESAFATFSPHIVPGSPMFADVYIVVPVLAEPVILFDKFVTNNSFVLFSSPPASSPVSAIYLVFLHN